MSCRHLLLCALLPSVAYAAALSDFETPAALAPWHADKVCPDGLRYTRDPQALLRRRHALAKAIERLAK